MWIADIEGLLCDKSFANEKNFKFVKDELEELVLANSEDSGLREVVIARIRLRVKYENDCLKKRVFAFEPSSPTNAELAVRYAQTLLTDALILTRSGSHTSGTV